ncbi:LPS assembly lipoprotein LptE [Bacteroidales bacterium OttesenSCG-928-A17]|nr:LPS assembly lipoprotein LptE [Bacteroidales bacterium OttesenSCG-928-A17]
MRNNCHCGLDSQSHAAIRRLRVKRATTGSKLAKTILLCSLLCLLYACSISYGFEGGSINYDKTKTIQIHSFPNRTSFYPEMTQTFDQAIRRRFIEQTRLREVSSNADIEISGEITGYTLTPMAVKSDAYASQTRLTITVKVEYVNNRESGKDVSQSFSQFLEFDSSQSLSSVEDQLVKDITDALIDEIYNATVANW